MVLLSLFLSPGFSCIACGISINIYRFGEWHLGFEERDGVELCIMIPMHCGLLLCLFRHVGWLMFLV